MIAKVMAVMPAVTLMGIIAVVVVIVTVTIKMIEIVVDFKRILISGSFLFQIHIYL